jgi:hypothetical protein
MEAKQARCFETDRHAIDHKQIQKVSIPRDVDGADIDK